MKCIIQLLLFFVCLQNISAQEPDKKQIAAGESFLTYVFKGDIEKAWQLFDKKNAPAVSRKEFDTGIKQIQHDFAMFDTFGMSMYGMKFIDDKLLNLYTFKAVSKTKNITDVVSIDLLFYKSSELIAGIQPKTLVKDVRASTSKAHETEIEKSFTAVIENVKYTINGINIVDFENNSGLLAIQVETILPDKHDQIDSWAKKEGVKFAKYLLANGYIDKAKIKIKETNRTLLEDIGVSFYNTASGAGYNVMIKPAEYK